MIIKIVLHIKWGDKKIRMERLQKKKDYNIKKLEVIAESLLDKNIKKISENQKKMLYELYYEYIRDGLDAKDAIEKAYKIIRSFN